MAATTDATAEEAVRGVFDAWNDGDRAAFDAWHDEDLVLHGREDVRGRDAVLAHQWGFFDSFSDAALTLDELIADGDRAALRYTMTGTHDGPFEGIDPTGRGVELSLLGVVHVADGRITDKWIQADTLGLLEQLGVEVP